MPFIFRFTGRFDWKQIYRDGRAFWLHRVASEDDFTETLYKHKGSQLTVKWEAVHHYDAYYSIAYTIQFKTIKPKMVYVDEDGVRREMVEGPMRVWIDYQLLEEPERQTPAGSSKVFQSPWLKAIYRKVTWRDRWDLVDDIGMFTCNDYMETLKKDCGMHAGGYASIWEPG